MMLVTDSTISVTKIVRFEKLKKKTKASHFGPSVYHYKLLKGKPTELERLMEAEVTN